MTFPVGSRAERAQHAAPLRVCGESWLASFVLTPEEAAEQGALRAWWDEGVAAGGADRRGPRIVATARRAFPARGQIVALHAEQVAERRGGFLRDVGHGLFPPRFALWRLARAAANAVEEAAEDSWLARACDALATHGTAATAQGCDRAAGGAITIATVGARVGVRAQVGKPGAGFGWERRHRLPRFVDSAARRMLKRRRRRRVIGSGPPRACGSSAPQLLQTVIRTALRWLHRGHGVVRVGSSVAKCASNFGSRSSMRCFRSGGMNIRDDSSTQDSAAVQPYRTRDLEACENRSHGEPDGIDRQPP